MRNLIDCLKKRVNVRLKTTTWSGEEMLEHDINTEGVLSMGVDEAEIEFTEVSSDNEKLSFFIQVKDGKAVISRESINMSNTIVLDPYHVNIAAFNTEFGSMEMKIITESLDIDFRSASGHIEASYLFAFSKQNEYQRCNLRLEYSEINIFK